ncbi:MAG TPA: tRNA (adenosine(37)-N6)-dimethylallyltransferase MiaA [Kiritimatiellia bacterium]|nr:tRNA (adenosine(37)-N6)-dimethylallyltransferase MiaA [Kiritimatiellia bacterium]HRZ12905.1 tRNA (adenosine(37)-N6)-dimethylallyltransferase MiaA [Kiritimatiellia bacterium]HSA18485.1 tRNA (adenosine(37)-N6)-dimethylallyltransferase MiaA [Kiritimatiellia bacterium]
MAGSPTAWFLVGPTAAGKSAVAQYLAEREGLDILSADSMLVYRGMDVGTDKPTADERSRVRYWGLDLVEPAEPFSVGRFLEAAREAFRAAAARVIVAGGTGLYVKGLVEGLDAAPPADPDLRKRLSELDVAGLQEELRRRDPARLESLADPRNPRRLIRAIELAECGARGVRPAREPGAPLVGLKPEPARWRARIAERVTRMFEGGLLDEARRLRERGDALSGTARHAIGYAEAFAALDGTLTVGQAREQAVRRTWQLARRQMTWFRHQVRVEWIDHDFSEPVARLADRVWAAWRKHGPNPVILPG